MSSLAAIDSFSFSFFGDVDKPIEHYFPPTSVVSPSTASLDQPKEPSSTAPSKSPRMVSLPVPPEQAPPSTLPKSHSPPREVTRPRSPSPRRTQVPSKRSRSSSRSPRPTTRPAGSPSRHPSPTRSRRENKTPPRGWSPSRSPRTKQKKPPVHISAISSEWRPSVYLPTEFSRPSRFDLSAAKPKTLPSNSKLIPRDTTALTKEMLFPSLKGLNLSSYSRYLLEEPIEVAWSADYYQNLDSFFSSCAPKEKWGSGTSKESEPRAFFPIVAHIQSHQPDKAAIRRMVGQLGNSLGFKSLPEHLHFRIRAMRDVMRWIWEGTTTVSMENASWLVLESSRDRRLLPIYILLREHASTLRYSDYVEFTRAELVKYLKSKSSSQLSKRERRALVLLDWLSEDALRWFAFFCTPDRRMRAREGEAGEWWLREPKDGEKRDKRALDDWERETMRKEDWRASTAHWTFVSLFTTLRCLPGLASPCSLSSSSSSSSSSLEPFSFSLLRDFSRSIDSYFPDALPPTSAWQPVQLDQFGQHLAPGQSERSRASSWEAYSARPANGLMCIEEEAGADEDSPGASRDGLSLKRTRDEDGDDWFAARLGLPPPPVEPQPTPETQFNLPPASGARKPSSLLYSSSPPRGQPPAPSQGTLADSPKGPKWAVQGYLPWDGDDGRSKRVPKRSKSKSSRRPLALFDSKRLSDALASLQRGLGWDDYAPSLIVDEPVEPKWSVEYGYAQLRFLEFCSPRDNWSSRPSAPSFGVPSFLPLLQQVMEIQPDLQHIRRSCPLRSLLPPMGLNQSRDFPRWASMLEVVEWVWGDAPDKWANVAWVVQEVPRPLLALLRQFADSHRYRQAVQHAWRECSAYLFSSHSSSTTSSARESRARTLVKWLDDGGEARKIRFFCDEAGRARRPGREGSGEEDKEVWEWWFKDLGRERVIEELDGWERRGMASGSRAR